MRISQEQAIRYRLRVNHLWSRLPSKSYEDAARFGLQDSYPRSALLSLHARVADCEPMAWADSRLIQTYSPRAAVYVLPRADFGVFTLGRAPSDPDERREIEARADRVCRFLDGGRARGRDLPEEIANILRSAAPTGRIALVWDARSQTAFEVPRPDVDIDDARLELCRRHVRAFGPSTPETFAWWAGVSRQDGLQTWRRLSGELLTVDYEGRSAVILREDEEVFRSSQEHSWEPDDVRLLPGEEIKLLVLFAGSKEPKPPDTFHPHPVVVAGVIAGFWGRRQGRVRVKLHERVPKITRSAIEAEALSMPIPGVSMSAEFLGEI